MDPNTGMIYKNPTQDQIEGMNLQPIPDDAVSTLTKMNRKARRAWLAAQRRRK